MSEIDLEKYRRHVAHFDMPEAQKTELLRAVWRIMQSFVDRAFGDDPVQQCTDRRDRLNAEDATPEQAAIELTPIEDADKINKLSNAFKANDTKHNIRKE